MLSSVKITSSTGDATEELVSALFENLRAGRPRRRQSVSSRRKSQQIVENHHEEHPEVKAKSRPLQPSDFGLPHEQAGPVLSSLIRAFVENWCQLAATVENASALA